MSRELANDLAKVALTKFASKKEVADYISQLITVVKDTQAKIKDSAQSDLDDNKKAIQSAVDTLTAFVKDNTKELKGELSRTTNDWYKSLSNEVYKLEQLIKNIPQYDSTQIEAKFSAVITDLSGKIPTIPEIDGYVVREALEGLPDDQKLTWRAVDGAVGIHIGKEAPAEVDMLWIKTS